jgi:hypothetical protein
MRAVISVRDFGAIPDDGKDDSVAIQWALDTDVKADPATTANIRHHVP